MADKALLIGINDYETVGRLRGCVNDVMSMEALLTGKFGFKSVRKLLNGEAKKDEVKKQMAWLFQRVSPGDRLVYHFSGHGSYTADEDGDEEDGADELICLCDMSFANRSSYLLDD